jgi:lysophospholipase L1-like esterase
MGAERADHGFTQKDPPLADDRRSWFRNVLLAGTVVAWAGAIWVVSHRSGSGQVLGRYSADYFKIVLAAVFGAAVMSVSLIGPVYVRLHAVRFQMLMLAASGVFGLVLAEVGIRILDPLGISYYDDLARYQADLVTDEDVGYRHRPGLKTRYYGTDVSCNTLGFRDREFGEKGADEFRVMVLGDSVTFGVGVEEGETFSRRLEPLLSARLGRPVRTMNFGVASYNTMQELACLEKFSDSLVPDLVICLFVDNDVVLKVGNFGPRLTREAAKPSPARTIMKWLGKSWLYRVAVHVLRHRGESEGMIPRDSKGWIGSMGALGEMAEHCRVRDMGFVTFLWRTRPGPLTDALWEDISMAAKQGNFPAADVGPWFADVDLNTIRNSPVDGHPNALGHEISAKGMAAFLLESGLLPVDVPSSSGSADTQPATD